MQINCRERTPHLPLVLFGSAEGSGSGSPFGSGSAVGSEVGSGSLVGSGSAVGSDLGSGSAEGSLVGSGVGVVAKGSRCAANGRCE